MLNNIEIAEQRFQDFIPLVKKSYPNGRLDKTQAKNLAAAYQTITMSEDVVVALFDHRTISCFFISENIEQLGGYTAKQVLNWQGLLLFKALHYSHYSYIYTSLKWNLKFAKEKPIEQRSKLKAYIGGLKLVDKAGNIRKVFLKGKVLDFDEEGQPDISVFFIEEVTHLFTGDQYWFRFENEVDTFAYIHQKGKKVFSDLLSARELEIMRLIAKNKTTKEIANELYLSPATVETHRKNMIKRTGAINSTGLVHLCKMANLF